MVDDDPISRGLIVNQLAGMPASAVEAGDGQEAWQQLVAGRFDLAFVDLNMPNVDGFELIRCIRSFPRTRYLPVVVVTSHSDKGSIARALEAGATSFLTKPISWPTFRTHIESLLRLTRDARFYRDQVLQVSAVSRAKDQIIAGLCAEVSASASRIETALRQAALRPLGSGAGSDAAGTRQKLAQAIGETETLVASASSAQKIIGGLETLTDIESELVSIDVIIDNVARALRHNAADAGIEIEVIAPVHEIVVSCDRAAIELALRNLMRNAITHSPRGKSVSISASSYPDGLVAIEIADSGSGMSPDFVAARLAPLSAQVEGVGGGLGAGWAISKAIAEAHNGKLEIHSMLAHGTSALLILPHERLVSATPRGRPEPLRGRVA